LRQKQVFRQKTCFCFFASLSFQTDFSQKFSILNSQIELLRSADSIMKNIPTNLFADNQDKIVIRTWESGGGEMPRKVQKAISEFEISIDNEEFTVY
jgi:hypothetical protein